ncbi:ATP-dependent Clp protease proteolytic subunit [Buchnera aphidicola]|uniref:ATP-dependent Clp protease proteolytic subunit n=1 Tax=Buchnera aphidicola (Cinara cf. splendens/pseudotsugae 3390) TaxID=2518980 RepID=A0A451CXN4_9GAMM|nr:ATP-dependent Clp protease proteolytic subunit [Buchnera aphidicola]VFP77877.1 ATP-dependent Clp protease proteolytic subunit [Buchnera aphidicola (Cinara cf. splendens/pseudotsugae 3390)]
MKFNDKNKQKYHNMSLIPFVIDKSYQGERSYDIFSRLLKDRIIFITGTINDNLASIIISQILFLEAEDKKKDIFLYINSPGGIITSGLSIYDTMQFVKPDINTICLGQACSMAAILLCAGKKGKRFCLPNARIMLHQPLGGFQGQASDIIIHAREIKKIKKTINYLLSYHTQQSIEKITQDIERDYFFSPKEAIKYGLIDLILKNKK